MDGMEPISIAQLVYSLAKGGHLAYKQADKRVAAYAGQEGITQEEAWRRVRAEAKRRGEDSVVKLADGGLRGTLILTAINPMAPIAAAAWSRNIKKRRLDRG